MDETRPKPKRRWYRKKRWWAAGLLWLALAYPLSGGPAYYADERGWLPPSVSPTCHDFYGPARRLLNGDTRVSVYGSYIVRCRSLGWRHAHPGQRTLNPPWPTRL